MLAHNTLEGWQPTLAFWEIPGTEEPDGLQAMGHKELDVTEGLNNITRFCQSLATPNHLTTLLASQLIAGTSSA